MMKLTIKCIENGGFTGRYDLPGFGCTLFVNADGNVVTIEVVDEDFERINKEIEDERKEREVFDILLDEPMPTEDYKTCKCPPVGYDDYPEDDLIDYESYLHDCNSKLGTPFVSPDQKFDDDEDEDGELEIECRGIDEDFILDDGTRLGDTEEFKKYMETKKKDKKVETNEADDDIETTFEYEFVKSIQETDPSGTVFNFIEKLLDELSVSNGKGEYKPEALKKLLNSIVEYTSNQNK